MVVLFHSHRKIQAFNLFLYLFQIYLYKISAACMNAPCVCIGRREGKWVESSGKWKVTYSAQGLYNILSAKYRRSCREGKDGDKTEGEERKRLIYQWKTIRADKQKSPEREQSLPWFCALAWCTVRLLALRWKSTTQNYIKPKLTAWITPLKRK